MTTKSSIEAFLGEKTLAVAGVSRSGKKFGNAVFRELRTKGYTVYPVNPNTDSVEEATCYPDLASIPEPVGGVVAVLPPAGSLEVAKQLDAAGVRKLWLQKGAESPEVLAFCSERGIDAVSGECILMFSEPVASIHKFHRFLRGVFGRLPK